MYKVITIGDVVLDTHVKIDNADIECGIDGKEKKLCLDYAAKIPISDSWQSLGGNAANVAVGLTKLGFETAVLSSVGYDTNGHYVVTELSKRKVDTHLISADKQNKTRYSIILNYQGERTILSYHKKREYFWPKKFPHTEWIYYTSLSDGFAPLQDKLLEYLKKHASVGLAFNPGTFQIKYSLKLLREILHRTDILILNLEEAEIISGITLGKAKSVGGIINRLLQTGAHEVVVTDADKGAWAGNNEMVLHADAYPVKVVAKTGAGDAFSAGYLSARIHGHGIGVALTWGIANSSSVISQYGSHDGLSDKSGLKKMMARYKNIIPTKA